MSAAIETSRTVRSISPADAQAMLQKGELIIIDVRTGIEHALVHAAGVEHIPLDRLNCADLIKQHAGKTIACICQSGTRGGKAAQQLLDAGCEAVANIAGGTEAWERAGLPVERRSGVVSLERQVRIAAGALVLTGVLLGYFVHVGFLGLSAFVGAGLVFAGITNFCGMGLLLARMPWNQNLNNNKTGGAACAA